jgi:5,10-methylenetetrahydromethanopterin reductase
VRWALRHLKRKCSIACIAPALVLPDKEHEEELLSAAAVVASGANQVFLEEMGIAEKVGAIRKALGRRRGMGEHADFLLEYFTISGSVEEVVDRVKELAELGVEQVILGSPFVKSRRFEKIINSISERLSP